MKNKNYVFLFISGLAPLSPVKTAQLLRELCRLFYDRILVQVLVICAMITAFQSFWLVVFLKIGAIPIKTSRSVHAK